MFYCIMIYFNSSVVLYIIRLIPRWSWTKYIEYPMNMLYLNIYNFVRVLLGFPELTRGIRFFQKVAVFLQVRNLDDLYHYMYVWILKLLFGNPEYQNTKFKVQKKQKSKNT